MSDMKIPKLSSIFKDPRVLGAVSFLAHIIGEGIPYCDDWSSPGPPETRANQRFFCTLIIRVRLFLGDQYIGGWKR